MTGGMLQLWLAIFADAATWLSAHRPTGRDVFQALLVYWGILRVSIMVSAVLILISSLDDLIIDVAYWLGRLDAMLHFWRRQPRQALLDKHPEKLIAIMVPAWQEADVIASMVANTNRSFDYSRYHIFVGVYANDPDTRREVDKVRQRFPNVHRAEVPHDGPTSKADCLNWLVQNILLHEQRTGDRFDVFLMHDAEDVVHPYGLKVVNWFIEEAGMVQTPVLSMDREWNRLIACHYMDEFAEFHSKDLVVRSAVVGMTPSAGVATAFHRKAMLALVAERNGQPFNTDSLTEDYDVAHRLSAIGLPSEFVRYYARVPRQRKAWFRKGMVTCIRRELVATKEFFPDKLLTSVRQKARWMLGISILGWKQLGWFGDAVNRYYLYRDRKALFTAPAAMFGYFIVIQVLGYMGLERTWPEAARLPPVIDRRWVWTLVTINFIFLVNRVFHRMWFTFANHGLKHVWLSPVRIVVSNIISFGAFWRASRQFLSHLITGRPIAWDKTEHAYPSLSQLQHGSGRIGETLRFWNHVSQDALDAALAEQKVRYRPLGLLLVDRAAVEDEYLAEAFAEAGQTYASIFDPFQIEPGVLRLLSRQDAGWYGAVPLRKQNGVLDVALAEPLPASRRADLQRLLAREGVKSVRFLYAPISDVAFAVSFAWNDGAFAAVRARLADLRARGEIDASREAMLWRSVRARHARLGDLLVRGGVLSHVDLQTAQGIARQTGKPLGEVLIIAGQVAPSAIEAARDAQPAAAALETLLVQALDRPRKAVS